MKKLLSKLFLMGTAAVMLLNSAALTACGEHVAHTWGEWETTKPALCLTPGEKMRTCTVCGESQTQPIPEIGVHDFSIPVNEEATCGKEGMSGFKCSRCGELDVKTTPALQHELGEYVSTKDVTCTEDGEGYKECVHCHKRFPETVPHPGHNFTQVNEIEKADCNKPGKKQSYCDRCEQWIEDTIPQLEHKWKILEEIKPASCDKAGLARAQCENCDEVNENYEIPKKEHNLAGVQGHVIQEATCEHTGTTEYTCKTCGQNVQIETPMVDHKWSTEYYIDVPASFDAPGSESVHCEVCDASNPNKKKEIPKLEADKKIKYEFRVVRTNGARLTTNGLSLYIYEATGDGDLVKVVNSNEIINGVAKVELLPADYKVEVDASDPNFRGYTPVSEFFSVTAGNPVCKIVLKGSLLPASEKTKSTRYGLHSVVHDFTITSVKGEQYTLSDLLAKKKFVMINFFFTTCGPCIAEIPGMNAQYLAFQNDMELLSISIHGPQAGASEDTKDKILSPNEYGYDPSIINFPQFVYNELAENFVISAAPTNIIIDSEGVVCEIEVGSRDETYFRSLFRKYSGATETAAASELEAILPDKRNG